MYFSFSLFLCIILPPSSSSFSPLSLHFSFVPFLPLLYFLSTLSSPFSPPSFFAPSLLLSYLLPPSPSFPRSLSVLSSPHPSSSPFLPLPPLRPGRFKLPSLHGLSSCVRLFVEVQFVSVLFIAKFSSFSHNWSKSCLNFTMPITLVVYIQKAYFFYYMFMMNLLVSSPFLSFIIFFIIGLIIHTAIVRQVTLC